MCGIAGFQSADRHLSKRLQHSRELLSHRGPDDSGSFEDLVAGIGLVHTRLAILDLSPLGHQPMRSADGRVVIVFNGEIYNFRELRIELEQKGCIFRGLSDTEVLLQLYLFRRHDTEGIANMLRQLNGIFAFAIWDADTETLLLARDALGVKPLYYSSGKHGFAFASEIKALLPLIGADGDEVARLNDIDVSALDRYLTYLWCPGSQTPSRRIKKLLPGQAMWVKQGQMVDSLVWYQLPVFRLTESLVQKRRSMGAQDAIRGTERHLRQAVHRQLVADVQVGAFLSGGLDSSGVVAFAREQNPDIRCFTIETSGSGEDGIVDDLPYARRVAKHLNVPLEVVRIDAERMAADLPSMIALLDEPLADPAPLNVLYISRLAREQGIKVLLSGAGGDDLFTGYRRHRALMSEGVWSWLPRPVRAGIEQITSNLDQSQPLLRRLRKMFNGATLDSDERLVNYFRWVDRRDLISLYTPEFRAALGDARAEDTMLTFLAELPPQTSRLERMLALEQRFFLTDHNLTYTDKMSMAAGVEVRVPFLDLDLVEFAAKIPARFKQRGSQGKWVLKKAMEAYLPRDVIYRPKSGFGAPLRHWMRVELRDLLAEILGTQSLLNRGLFEPVAVQKLIVANDKGEIDASYTLLALMCIELWCRRFMDQTVVAVGTDFKEKVS
jgi:asparagine synthase (glutamine-hydrolysing)